MSTPAEFTQAPNSEKEIMGTKGKELLVGSDLPQWRTKFIIGIAFQECWAGFQDPTTYFLKRNWSGPDGSGGTRIWSDAIASGGNAPVAGTGDPNNSHGFDDDPAVGWAPTSNTHADNSAASPPILTKLDLALPEGASDPYGRAHNKATSHNYSEIFWQDALQVTERDFYCSNFNNTDTTNAVAVDAAAVIPSPWDQSDYGPATGPVNGYTSDQPFKNAPSSPDGSAGWLATAPSNLVTAYVQMTWIQGIVQVDRPTYGFFYSQPLWDEPSTQDPFGNLYFLSDGIYLPGISYAFPAPAHPPFMAPIPSPPTPGGYSGTQVGESIFFVIGISPESYAASLGLTWFGDPFVMNR